MHAEDDVDGGDDRHSVRIRWEISCVALDLDGEDGPSSPDQRVGGEQLASTRSALS